MRDLSLGERVVLEGARLDVDVDGPEMDRRAGQLGAVVIALDAGGRVPADVRPVVAVGGEARPGIGFVDGGVLRIETDRVPAAVERIMMVVYATAGVAGGVTMRDFRELTLTTGAHRVRFDLTSRGEAAMILVEVYRHGGRWKLTASGQGFTGGIGALANALGIELDVPRADPPPAPERFRDGGPPRPAPGSTFSGSGFAVDRRHVLTNAHVVDGAHTIRAASDRETLACELVFSDPRNDMALLRLEREVAAAARFRERFDLHLGEDVVVLGYPLQGLLGAGPQASGGNVSSLCGIGSDTSVLQFTAPIASGNSGGPILDTSGLVVGLVHASLNIDRVREGGGTAENVNFGVKGAMARAFLAAAGIEPATAPDAAARARAEIVREARAYLYRVQCEA